MTFLPAAAEEVLQFQKQLIIVCPMQCTALDRV